MIVKHSCGHTVDVPPYFEHYVRREVCKACQRLAKELQEKQDRLFKEARSG